MIAKINLTCDLSFLSSRILPFYRLLSLFLPTFVSFYVMSSLSQYSTYTTFISLSFFSFILSFPFLSHLFPSLLLHFFSSLHFFCPGKLVNLNHLPGSAATMPLSFLTPANLAPQLSQSNSSRLSCVQTFTKLIKRLLHKRVLVLSFNLVW